MCPEAPGHAAGQRRRRSTTIEQEKEEQLATIFRQTLTRHHYWIGAIGLLAAIAAFTFIALVPVSTGHAQVPPADTAPAAEEPSGPPPADRTGNGTGTGADLAGVAPGTLTADDFTAAADKEPFALKLSDLVAQNRLGINFTWLLVTGYLVMFMQAGFALVEVGLLPREERRPRHVHQLHGVRPGHARVLRLRLRVCLRRHRNVGVGELGRVRPTQPRMDREPRGRRLGHPGAQGLLPHRLVVRRGDRGVLPVPDGLHGHGRDDPHRSARRTLEVGRVRHLLDLHRCGDLPGLRELGMGRRLAIPARIARSGFGNGYLDFAGSGVVHAVGGWTALAGALVLGPRIGKFNKDGTANAIPGHNIMFAALGTFILAFGWFGFNPGSTFGASGNGSLRIGMVATVTMLAGAAGSFTAMAVTWLKSGKPDAGMMINGLLAGLVAITAPSGFVSPASGVVIGAIAGVVVVYAVSFFENVLKIDDPVGAISVHGVNGLWGQLALGIFADGTANYGGVTAKGALFGDFGQLGAQMIGAGVAFVWAFGAAFVFFKVLDGRRALPQQARRRDRRS